MSSGISKKMLAQWLRTPAAVVTVVSAAVIVFNVVFSFTVAASMDSDVSIIKLRKGHLGDWRDSDPVFMYAKAAEDLQSFKNRLPDEQAVNKTLSVLYDEGKKAGVRITKGSYKSEEVKKAGMARYAVTLPVEGVYANIKRFIAYLDANPGIVVVEDLTFSKGSASGQAITIKLSLSAYYR